jgi:PAS domain S-box-containing protein
MVSRKDINLQKENARLKQRVAELEQQLTTHNCPRPEPQHDTLLQAIPAGLVLLDHNLCCRKANQAAADIHNLPVAEHIGKPLNELAPEYSSTLVPACQQVLASGQPVLDIEVQRAPANTADKPRFWNASVFPVATPDTAESLGILFVDTTQQQQTTIALRESQMLLSDVLDHSPAAIYVKDIDGTFCVFNKQVANLSGYTPDQVIGKNEADLFPPELVTVWRANKRQVLESRKPLSFEEYFPQPDGDHTFYTYRFPIFNTDGEIYALGGISTDITSQKRTEEELRESQERLQFILEGSNDGAWDWNIADNMAYLSPRYKEMLGYAPDELPNTPESWTHMIHPADVPNVQRHLFAYLEGRSSSYAVEHRLQHKSGEWRWIVSRGKIVARNAEGHPLRMTGTCSDITDRKRAEAALQQSETRLQFILEGSSDGAWDWDLFSNAVYVSEQGKRLLGYQADELPNDVDIWKAMLHPDDMAGTFQCLNDYLDGRSSSYRVEYRLRHKSGGWRWMLSRGKIAARSTQGKPLRVTGTFSDITERKRLEEDLRKSKALLQGMLDHSPAAIYVKDATGHMLLVNRFFTEWIGLPTAEIIGKHWHTIFPSELVRLWSEHEQQIIATGEYIQVEEPIAMADGIHTYLTTKFPLYDDQGTFYAIAGIATNITERKRVEEAMQQMTGSLQVVNTQLERVAHMKDEFLANMSHELRTPLNVILGLAEVLQEEIYGSLNNEQLTLLKNVEQSGHQLLHMINDILDLSRIEAGKGELALGPVSVEDVCRASLQAVRYSANKKHLVITHTIANTQVQIIADERRLRQILANLLENAVKFTPDHGQVSLDVAIDDEHQQVHFAVWDTGIGIAQEDIPLLFQPFTQLDSKLSRRYEGTGLGLALAARLVALHQGTISVESELGKGSRFVVTLPWEPHMPTYAPPAQHNIPTPEPERGCNGHVTPKTLSLPQVSEVVSLHSSAQHPLILLAEDNEETIEMMRVYLESKGYRLVVARNGKEAIDLAHEHLPHLILMDIQMPKMDGLEATRHMRASPELKHTPIIALTALVMPGDRERCLEAGADDYMIKPGSLKKVLHSIESHLGRKP